MKLEPSEQPKSAASQRPSRCAAAGGQPPATECGNTACWEVRCWLAIAPQTRSDRTRDGFMMRAIPSARSSSEWSVCVGIRHTPSNAARPGMPSAGASTFGDFYSAKEGGTALELTIFVAPSSFTAAPSSLARAGNTQIQIPR